MSDVRMICDDCMSVMATLPESSVDLIVASFAPIFCAAMTAGAKRFQVIGIVAAAAFVGVDVVALNEQVPIVLSQGSPPDTTHAASLAGVIITPVDFSANLRPIGASEASLVETRAVHIRRILGSAHSARMRFIETTPRAIPLPCVLLARKLFSTFGTGSGDYCSGIMSLYSPASDGLAATLVRAKSIGLFASTERRSAYFAQGPNERLVVFRNDNARPGEPSSYIVVISVDGGGNLPKGKPPLAVHCDDFRFDIH